MRVAIGVHGRRGTLAALVLAGTWAAAGVAMADPDAALAGSAIVYARGAALFKSDPRGRGETQLVVLPAAGPVRVLRTDPAGKVLLADVGGHWYWMPLDGSASALAPLACGDGPAQLAADASCVVCRSTAVPAQSQVVKLATGQVWQLAGVPAAGTRLVGTGGDRRVVWADATGVWSAPPMKLTDRTQLAKEAPLRGFLPTPDGKRALGVYADTIHDGKQQKPVEWLMEFPLDGAAPRRKSMRHGVPVEWSHDLQWALIQDRAAACIVRVVGGQYKCWAGYTAVAVAPDGSYALVLGNRDRDAKSKSDPSKSKSKSKKSDKSKSKGDPSSSKAKPDSTEEQASDEEPQAAPEGTDAAGSDDLAVKPPSGPLALYRTKLDGPYSDPPALVVSLVDGAAVVIP